MRAHTGQLVRDARNSAGLTVTELANRLGCSKTTISLMENGHRPVTPEWAARIEQALQRADNALLAQACWDRLPEAIRNQVPELVTDTRTPSARDITPGVAADSSDVDPDTWRVEPVTIPTFSPEDTIAFSVSTDDLAPRYQAGDIVMARAHSTAPYDGMDCIVRYSDEDATLLARVTLERDDPSSDPVDGNDLFLSHVTGRGPMLRVERDELEMIAPMVALLRPLTKTDQSMAN